MISCPTEQTSDDELIDAQGYGAPIESPTASEFVDGEGCDGGPKYTDEHEKGREPIGLEVIVASCPEDGARTARRLVDALWTRKRLYRLDDDGRDTRAVLHQHLQPECELNSPSKMEVARTNTEEHLDVVCTDNFLLFLDDSDDLVVLS